MDKQLVITGNEPDGNLTSPIVALIQFYRAFNQRNMGLMATNWNNNDESVMSNPLGGIKRGWREISLVYDKIFNGPAEVYVEFYDFQIIETGEMFFAAGRERGYFKTEDVEISLAIRTSRIFMKDSAQWKQVHHHGSIEDPELLAAYQNVVLKL